MKKPLIIVLLLITPLLNNTAQMSNKYFSRSLNKPGHDNTNGISIGMNNNGRYTICGDTKDSLTQHWRSYFAQVDQYGNLTSFNDYPDSIYGCVARDLVITEDGIFGAGFADNSQMLTQSYIVRSDTIGSLVSYGIPEVQDFVNSTTTACRTHDGGFLLGGECQPLAFSPPGQTNNTHPYLIRLDSQGNFLWDTIYYQYGDPYAWFVGMTPAPDGDGYLITGTTNNTKGIYGDLLFLKIDDAGNVIWDYLGANFSHMAIGNHIIATKDKGYLVTGYSEDFFEGSNTLLVRLDSSRQLLWHVIDYFDRCGSGRGAVELSDGSFVLAGCSSLSPSDDLEGVFVKIRGSDGGLLWRRTYDQAGFDDYAYDMLPTPDGGYLACGRTEYYDFSAGIGQANLYLLKVNCMGLQSLPQAAFIASEATDSYLCAFQNLSEFVYPDSTDGGHFIWDFGDGSAPQIDNNLFVSHTFPGFGTYPVRLTAVVCSDTSVVEQVVGVFPVGLPQIGMGGFMVYPNPAQDYLVVENNSQEQSATFVLYDMMGRQVLSVISHNQSVVPIEHLPSGVYLYQFLNPQNQILAYGKVSVVR
jgi:hypothetical protein